MTLGSVYGLECKLKTAGMIWVKDIRAIFWIDTVFLREI